MFEKLELMLKRYDELTGLIGDPELQTKKDGKLTSKSIRRWAELSNCIKNI